MSFSFFKDKRHVWTRSVQSHKFRGACHGGFFFSPWPHKHPSRLSVLALVTEPHLRDEVQEVFHSHAGGCWHRAAQQTRIPSSPSKTLEILRVSVYVCVSLFVFSGQVSAKENKRWLDAESHASQKCWCCYFWFLFIALITIMNQSPWRRKTNSVCPPERCWFNMRWNSVT